MLGTFIRKFIASKLQKLALVMALSIAASNVLAANVKIHRKPDRIPDHYVVRLDSDFKGTVRTVAEELTGRFGGKLRYVYTEPIVGFAMVMPEAAVEGLSRDPRIELVVEDSPGYRLVFQSPVGWGLDRIDQRTTSLDNKYEYGCDRGTGVDIYIIDGGINAHPDFGTRVTNLYNAFPGEGWNDCPTFPHGTQVASIAAGTTYGVAKEADIFNVKVLGCTAGGTAEFLAGIQAVNSHHQPNVQAVANVSLIFNSDPNIDAAILNSDSEITWVVGAGNGAWNVSLQQYEPRDANNFSPQTLGDVSVRVITVSATMLENGQDRRAHFPNASYPGHAGWSANIGTAVDIFAPGAEVDAADPDLSGGVLFRGTSAAAPYVTGQVARRIWCCNTSDTVESWLKNNATVGVINDVGAGSPNLLLYTFFPMHCRPI